MKERPILFSAPMVRALLAGTKTQTRRAVKGEALNWLDEALFSPEFVAARDNAMCPYGFSGDRLWVRESWQYADWTDDGYPWIGYAADGAKNLIERGITEEWGQRLMDIWADLSREENFKVDQRAADRRWRPSIHMPRWACRTVLEITSVRVERLHDLREADARAEGYPPNWMPGGDGPWCSPCQWYADLWKAINGDGSWAPNPWVWVVEFRKV